jgi:hypothetical protein
VCGVYLNGFDQEIVNITGAVAKGIAGMIIDIPLQVGAPFASSPPFQQATPSSGLSLKAELGIIFGVMLGGACIITAVVLLSPSIWRRLR